MLSIVMMVPRIRASNTFYAFANEYAQRSHSDLQVYSDILSRMRCEFRM